MSSAGTNARLGYEFQDAVAAHYAIRMLDTEDVICTAVEATGIEGHPAKVKVDDIVQCFSSGRRKFIQVKSSSPKQKNWTIDSLYKEKELEKVIAQLQACDSDSVELICPHGFGDLEELKKDVRNFSDIVSFHANADAAAISRLKSFFEKGKVSESDAFAYMQERISFGPRHTEQDWISLTRRLLTSEKAHDALKKLIVDHSLKRPNAPRSLTRAYVEKIVSPDNDETASKVPPATDSTRDWLNEEHYRRFPTNVVQIGRDHGGSSVEWPRCIAPNIQLCIRPLHNDAELKTDRLHAELASGRLKLPLFSPLSGAALGRNKWGVANYVLRTQDKPAKGKSRQFFERLGWPAQPPGEPDLIAFTQLYDTGTAWFVDSLTLELRESEHQRTIPPHIERNFVATLSDARSLLHGLGIAYPYEVRATLRGIGNCRLAMLDSSGEPSGLLTHVSEETTVERTVVVQNETCSSLEALRPFFDDLWKSALTPRPAYYDGLHVPDAGQTEAAQAHA
ncbi:dsDNA nuclease domain-containing protein [Paraburkholderia nemoris]|uniref:dsDNA nuclease domain-containing protein n=1 Tax=Paraburkholderia nemoris TaxID=2793076 RepID=UPI0038B8CC5B